MMVPRSYIHQSPQRRSPPDHTSSNEKAMGIRIVRPKTMQPAVKKIEGIAKPAPPERAISEPAAVPSQPMAIPSRAQSTRPKPSHTQTLKSRGPHGGRKPRRLNDTHDPASVPPAVAALLAITAIPPPKSKSLRRQSSGTLNRRVSIDELIHEWNQTDDCRQSPTSAPPLNILLEEPEELESEAVSIFEGGTDLDRDDMLSRSTSSDSIPSMPSLANDNLSVSSLSSLTLTPPLSVRRRFNERRDKLAISPPTEECFDHPLLLPAIVSDNPWDNMGAPISSSTRRPPQKPRSTFKSNLTASLNALKSAAKSFSNFTAPSIPPDDLITRSLLSPQRFASEMRPKPVQGIPAPELRRYLNPASTQRESISPIWPTDLFTPDDSKPMIQLQNYDRTKKAFVCSKKQQRRDSILAATFDKPVVAVRQREPRENSDFLRVIVLEMNMRREGKLDAKAGGRARIWLPPRKTGGREQVAGSVGEVPVRWRGICAHDE